MYTFNFQPDNGYRGNDITELLMVTTPPVIPFAQELLQSMQLGDGTTVYRHTGVYQDITIQLNCNFIVETREKFMPAKTLVSRYFGDRQGKLSLCEDLDHYWKVKDVSIVEGARTLGVASDVSLHFTCDPYRYFKEYSQPVAFVTGEKTIFNNFYELSYPIYKIYNDSSNAKTITITNNNKALSITDPFKGRSISAEEGEKTQEVLYLELNTYWNTLKTVYDGSYEYQTIKTSGSFANIRFGTGINEVIVDIDLGSCRVEVQREYRER